MSNSNGHTQVPAGWLDALHPLKSSHVASTLAALGEEPRGWRSAAEASRLAEWKALASSSLHFGKRRDEWADRLAEAERRAAGRPGSSELQNFVISCQNNLRIAEEILAVAPGEAERLKLATDRQQVRLALGRLQDEVRQYELYAFPLPAETIDALTNLTEAVAADERQVERETKARQALQAAADELRNRAVAILSRALGRAVDECAEEAKALINARQVAIATAYPTMADPRITSSWRRAMGLARIALDLDGTDIDVDATFGQALNEKHWQGPSRREDVAGCECLRCWERRGSRRGSNSPGHGRNRGGESAASWRDKESPRPADPTSPVDEWWGKW